MFLCDFFWAAGFHVLYDAPANSNIEDFVALAAASEDFKDAEMLRACPREASKSLSNMITDADDGLVYRPWTVPTDILACARPARLLITKGIRYAIAA